MPPWAMTLRPDACKRAGSNGPDVRFPNDLKGPAAAGTPTT